MPAEASSSCPSDAKREATNANARYGVDDPFDRERPPPTERRTKETSSNDDYSKAALALGRPSHDGTLCPARDKKVCDDDSKEEETFARSMMMISTRSRFTRTDDESVRRFLPLENGRRDVFGLVSLLLLLGFFRRFVAIAAASVAARRCHLSLSLSLVDEDGFDGDEKKVKKKKKKKKTVEIEATF